MKKIAFLLIHCAVFFAPAHQAFAQEKMPVLNVPTEHEGLPNDYDFDVSGFKLLDTIAETDQKFSAYPSKSNRFAVDDNGVIGLRDNRGNQASFLRGRTYAGGTVNQSPIEMIDIQYTSPLNDSRVMSISRHVNFEEEVSKESLVRNVKEKYGDNPTLIMDSNYSLEFRYIFHNGELTPYVGGLQEIYNNEITKKCQYTSNEVPVGSSRTRYRFQEHRKKKYDGCNGEVKIIMIYGSRKDLFNGLRVSMWDYDLSHKDLHDQDMFLMEALDAERSGKVGKEAPKL